MAFGDPGIVREFVSGGAGENETNGSKLTIKGGLVEFVVWFAKVELFRPLPKQIITTRLLVDPVRGS